VGFIAVGRGRLGLGLALVSLLACAPGQAPPPPLGGREGLTGTDGPLTVSTVNRVLNSYSALTASAPAGATSLTVNALTDLDSVDFGPLAAGDLLLVVQAQGATIDQTDTTSYGAVTALNGAGLYELVTVTGVTAPNGIQLGCSGLVNAYDAAAHTQVVRVPQLTSLTVSAGASVTAPAWDGAIGGVVALHVQSLVSLDGDLDVSGKGFRGGAVDDASRNQNLDVTLYRSTSNADGASKGEGVAGFIAEYTATGLYGRGAPANAGGGGNSHNGGGGGGAHANAGGAYTGQGVMSAAVTGGAQAWPLDPGDLAAGGLTTSPGGGRGGYTYGLNDLDALTQGPGLAAWGGNSRSERGGLGGWPLAINPSLRLFLGGGGGAGDGNNAASGGGGAGGGLVVLLAGDVQGAGRLLANGAAGGPTVGANNDAAGGGGGGGTVLVLASSTGAVSIEARGGVGGSQGVTTAEADGPGGGGGGGLVAAPSGTGTVSVAGGAGGTSAAPIITEFPGNGATGGNLGQIVAAPLTIPACIVPGDAGVAGDAGADGGAVDGGAVDGGAADGGAADGGAADGGAADGGAADGGAADGGAADGGAADGGAADGGAADGGAADAGAADGGAADGGAVDGGVADGGVGDAGVADGGATDGGATDAGATDAGTDAGVVDAGVTDAGEADAGQEGVADAGLDGGPLRLRVGCDCTSVDSPLWFGGLLGWALRASRARRRSGRS